MAARRNQKCKSLSPADVWNVCLCVAMLLICLCASSAQTKKEIANATVVGVQTLEKPVSVTYIGKVLPVYTYDKIYDVAVRMGDAVVVGRFSPITDYFPAGWEAGNPVNAKADRHFLYLKRNDVEEERLPIEHRYTWAEWQKGVPKGTLRPTEISPALPQPIQ